MTGEQIIHALERRNGKEYDTALHYFFTVFCPIEKVVAVLQKKMRVDREDAIEAYDRAIPTFVTKARQGKVKNPESLDAFFIGIAKFAIQDIWREKKKKRKDWEELDSNLIDEYNHDISGEDILLEKERMNVALEVLSSLKEQCKKLLAFYYEGHSHKEIATHFDFVKNEQQSKVQVFRCRQQFFALLRKHSMYKEIFNNG